MQPQALLEGALRIAVAAGEAIMQVYQSDDFDVSQKGDASPLTRADIAAHDLIIAGLKELTPDIPCLSEEDADIPFATRRTWQRYWLIDPLDGTKEFIKRNGDFTVNIALIESGKATLGVVHAPAIGDTYLAALGAGAFRIRGGQRQPIRTRKTPARPSLVASKSHRDASLDALLAKAPAHDEVSKGSSLKFCLVAEGSADLYPRTGPTSEWDTGAGQCVAEQAGCEIYTLPDWKPLLYNQKESILNPGFAVIGEPAYGWKEKLVLG